jgi:tetratricopeptide (TPR) repeat protein
VRVLALVLAWAAAGAGCSHRGAGPESGAGSGAEGCEVVTARGLLAPEDLGFSLAALSPAVPRHLPDLRAFVEEHGGWPEVEMERGAPAGEGAVVRPGQGLLGVAGKPACPLPEERLARAGEPPRIQQTSAGAVAVRRFAEAQAQLAVAAWPEARAALAAAVAVDAAVPEGPLRLGDVYAAEERWPEAARAYRAALARFPWSVAGHLRLAGVLRELGQRTEGIRELARALALRPASGDLWARLAERNAGLRVPVPPPAERLGGPASPEGRARWRLGARSDGSGFAVEEARTYAACKEAFRGAEDLRQSAAGLDGERWRWSPAEETVCTALWLGAYLRHRERGRQADAALDHLWHLAGQDQLGRRSLFDVGAAVHPMATAFLRAAEIEGLFAFVLAHRAGPAESGGLWF